MTLNWGSLYRISASMWTLSKSTSSTDCSDYPPVTSVCRLGFFNFVIDTHQYTHRRNDPHDLEGYLVNKLPVCKCFVGINPNFRWRHLIQCESTSVSTRSWFYIQYLYTNLYQYLNWRTLLPMYFTTFPGWRHTVLCFNTAATNFCFLITW